MSGAVDVRYVLEAVAMGAIITAALRAAPFVLKRVVADAAWLDDVRTWMPLGAVSILAVYCVVSADYGDRAHGVANVAAVVVVAGVHLWRRNLVLSIVSGTAVAVLLTQVLAP